MPESLSAEEIARVRALQIELHAVKRCTLCGHKKPVDQFPGYGVWICSACAVAERAA